jgi:hypothetical protein
LNEKNIKEDWRREKGEGKNEKNIFCFALSFRLLALIKLNLYIR